jgi:hypothetical protein
MEFLVHCHNHAGWEQSIEEAESPAEAINQAIIRHHDFLEAEYSGQYSIEVNLECTSYRVDWTDPEPKPIFGGYLWPGYWFGGKVRIGEDGDCPACGGTGVNHYNPFMQCWACGNSKEKGRGSGKTKDDNGNAE